MTRVFIPAQRGHEAREGYEPRPARAYDEVQARADRPRQRWVPTGRAERRRVARQVARDGRKK